MASESVELAVYRALAGMGVDLIPDRVTEIADAVYVSVLPAIRAEIKEALAAEIGERRAQSLAEIDEQRKAAVEALTLELALERSKAERFLAAKRSRAEMSIAAAKKKLVDERKSIRASASNDPRMTKALEARIQRLEDDNLSCFSEIGALRCAILEAVNRARSLAGSRLKLVPAIELARIAERLDAACSAAGPEPP